MSLDGWEFLFQPEFAHGFLKWGAQVGYTKSWIDVWLHGLGEALEHPDNLKQIDWQNSDFRNRHFQNCKRTLLLNKFGDKFKCPIPVEAQVCLAMETLSDSSPYLIPIACGRPKCKEKAPLDAALNSNVCNQSASRRTYQELSTPKTIPAPWGPILALSKNWASQSISERLSTSDVERMARELGRVSMKWDGGFLDELVDTLRIKSKRIPPPPPWREEDITILQLGSSIGALHKESSKEKKSAKFLPNDGLDPSARIQLAEMAAGAGHEINNPLAILTGTIQKLQKTWNHSSSSPGVDTSGPALELMMRQVQRVRTQIEELMWFSRPPEPKPVITNFPVLKRIWSESLRGVSTETAVSGGKPKIGGLILDPIHFGRVTRLLGEFLRQHLPKTPDSQPNFSFQRKEKVLVGKASGPFPNWTPSQILGLFTPFFCPKGFGRTSGLHLPAARAMAEKSGWSLSFVQGTKGKPGSLMLEIPIVKAKNITKAKKNIQQTPNLIIPEKMRYRPVA